MVFEFLTPLKSCPRPLLQNVAILRRKRLLRSLQSMMHCLDLQKMVGLLMRAGTTGLLQQCAAAR